MPIYCELFQLVIPKKVLEEKYSGGIDQFKLDHKWGKSVDHEDNELVSIASMENAFPIPKGLHYDKENKTSKDFVIVARYGTPPLSWEVEWCKSNQAFIWHKDCKPSSFEKMMEVSNMTVDAIKESLESGEKLLKDIW